VRLDVTRTWVSVALGGIAGVIGALSVVAIQTGIGGLDGGDILGFFGAIIGTALAVAGAVWIEERKRNAEMVETAQPVLDALLALERKSRNFFGYPGRRRQYVLGITEPAALLNRLLLLSPPRSARLIGLFDRLREGAAFLTSELYLMMDEQAPLVPGPQRSRVEELLEGFDTPLKLLIVEYSRLADPKSGRAVKHLGKMPEL
jgi:hypothetical protein